MTVSNISRRRALAGLVAPLVAPVLLGGCSLFDDWFSDNKPALKGDRESVAAVSRGTLVADESAPSVTVPAPVANADWPQAGGSPVHLGGNLARRGLNRAWSADIGTGGGYRRKITAQPVVADGKLFTMDSDGVVSAFDVATGHKLWERDTKAKKDRSSNVGGGIGFGEGGLYASTGRGELLRLDSGSGEIGWRRDLGSPARSAPTLADGKAFLSTIDERVMAYGTATGDKLWEYQAQSAKATVLGQPAPAYADGLVVAGFGSGDLLALRADTGSVSWADSLASVSGRDSLIDLSAIRGMPVIDGRTVYAAGLGGLIVAIDLRSGRRLWEHDAFVGDNLWVAGDWITLIATDQRMAALSKADGRVRWVTELPRYEKPEKNKGAIFWRGPVLAGGELLAASNTGQMTVADPITGEVKRTMDLADAAAMAPVVAGGRVFVVTDDGAVTAYA